MACHIHQCFFLLNIHRAWQLALYKQSETRSKERQEMPNDDNQQAGSPSPRVQVIMVAHLFHPVCMLDPNGFLLQQICVESSPGDIWQSQCGNIWSLNFNFIANIFKFTRKVNLLCSTLKTEPIVLFYDCEACKKSKQCKARTRMQDLASFRCFIKHFEAVCQGLSKITRTMIALSDHTLCLSKCEHI